MGGGDGRAYTFDSTEFGAEPSVPDYGMHHEHVADQQGASNFNPWLNHNVQVAGLVDSRFQDIENHVEGNDKSHWERLPCVEGRPTAWRHGTVEREAAKGVRGPPREEERMRHNSPTSPMRDEATHPASVAHHDGKYDDASHIGIDGLWRIVSICPRSAFQGFRLFVLRRPVDQSSISMTELRTSTTSHLLYALQHSASQLLASAQLVYKTKTSVIFTTNAWLSLTSRCFTKPRTVTCGSPMSGYLTTGSTTSSFGLYSNNPRSISEGRSDSRGRSRNRGSSVSIPDKSLSVGGPVCDRLRVHVTATKDVSDDTMQAWYVSTKDAEAYGGMHPIDPNVTSSGRCLYFVHRCTTSNGP